jgi:hypothetical protein
MKARKIAIGIVILILLVVVLVVAFPYRFVLLSKLNVSAGESEAALGLRKVVDIPLEGGATRFDYPSIDPQRGLLFIAHLGAGQVVVFYLKQQKVAA